MIKIKVAGHVFGLENKYDFVRFMCRDYLCDDEPEVVFESEVKMGKVPWEIVPAHREYVSFLKPICHYLLEDDTLLFHASSLAFDGKAYLFTAPGGTGKSTHSRLWRERFGDKVTMINDDKPFLHLDKQSGKITAYGSPWNGHHYIDTNTSAPVAGIVVMKQAPENTMRRLTHNEALMKFCKEAGIPDDFLLKLKALEIISHMTQLPVYELACTPTQDAVTLCHSTVTHGNLENV